MARKTTESIPKPLLMLCVPYLYIGFRDLPEKFTTSCIFN